KACTDRSLADTVVEAVWRFSPSLAVVGLPNSELESSARQLGLAYVREGFADRAYEPDGSLRDRKHAGAVIRSPETAATQALQLAQGEVMAHDGTPIQLEIDTICIHGDTPGAPNIARHVNSSLKAAHYRIGPAVNAPDR